MSKDNSKIAKVIVKYIIDQKVDDALKELSKQQLKVIDDWMPNNLKDKENISLFQNSQITGDDGDKYKITYNEKSKWVGFPNSQQQIKKLFENYNLKFDDSKTSKENFLDFIRMEDYGVQKYLEWVFEKMSDDYDFWTIIDNNVADIKDFDTSKFQFDLMDIETNILENTELSTWFIKVNGVNLLQVQVPASKNRPNSHIARLNVEHLDKFYQAVKITNETWGISVEVALCVANDIPIPKEYEKRYDPKMVEQALVPIKENMDSGELMPMTECLATVTDGTKKSPTDFMAGDQKVSVKTNFNTSTKVCPPEIGQPGVDEGLEYYNSVMGTSFTRETVFKDNMKEFKIAFIKNIAKIAQDQMVHLFSEDVLIYLRKTKKSIFTIVTNTKDIKFTFEEEHFGFTRNADTWNESTSIHYKGISIAEMQLHSGRSPFKFRFNWPNLLKLMKEND